MQVVVTAKTYSSYYEPWIMEFHRDAQCYASFIVLFVTGESIRHDQDVYKPESTQANDSFDCNGSQ